MVATKRHQQNEDAPADIGLYEIYECDGRGRGKEAGPALNPLKGSSAFLPPDDATRRTPGTKLNLLKTKVFLLSPRVKNPSYRAKFPPLPNPLSHKFDHLRLNLDRALPLLLC